MPIRVLCRQLVTAILFMPATLLAQGARPNILWITAEDMSPNLSMYGDATAYTPNLEKLTSVGVTYKNAFASSPVCSPSRSTLITGVYASTLGTHHHRSNVDLPAHIKPLPVLLQSAGYFCTNRTKTDYNFPVSDGMWNQNGKNAHWRNRSAPDQPFFSVFNFTVTHESLTHQSDRKFEARVPDVKPQHRIDPAKVLLPPYMPDTPIVRKDWARYYDTISQLDVEVGRLLQQLSEDGLATNTVVFFFSDHGQGLPRGKRWLYDSGLRVPLIVSWPGKLKASTVDEELISLIDVPPTVLALAGIDKPAYCQGRVLIGEGKEPEPQFVFATRDSMDVVHDMSRAVRDKKYKYIKNFYPERPYAMPQEYMDKTPSMKEWRRLHAEAKLKGAQELFFQKVKPAEELYHTASDPHEIRNLASQPEHAERLQQMRGALDRWQTATKDRGFEPVPEVSTIDDNQDEGNKGSRGEE